MQMIQRALFVLVALAFVFVTSSQAQSQAQQAPSQPGASQERPAQPQPPAPSVPQAGAQAAATSAQGELVEVVSKDNTLTIKTAAGAEMKFSYDDQTKVTGAQKGVAGLATMKGTQLTVQYKKEGDKNIATSIEVRPAAQLKRPAEPSARPAEPSPRPSEQPR